MKTGRRTAYIFLSIGVFLSFVAFFKKDDDNQTKAVAVLEIPPVNSAQTAVKVAIAAKAKETR